MVLWGPQWRPDQKDVTRREEAARRGIEHFFTMSDCYTETELLESAAGKPVTALSDEEVLRVAAGRQPMPYRVLVITVRELGPIVKLPGSPALVEGGTDVVVELRVFDVATGASLGAFQSHWQNGGPLSLRALQR